MILAPLQKLTKNVGDLGKFVVAKGFKKLPKVQKIANSGHTITYLLVAYGETDSYFYYLIVILDNSLNVKDLELRTPDTYNTRVTSLKKSMGGGGEIWCQPEHNLVLLHPFSIVDLGELL